MRYTLSAEFLIGKNVGGPGGGAIVSTSLGAPPAPSPGLGGQLLGQPVGGSFHHGEAPNGPIVPRGDTPPHHHHPPHATPELRHGAPHARHDAATTLGPNDYRLTDKGSSSADGGGYRIPLTGGAAARGYESSIGGMQPGFRAKLARMMQAAPGHSDVFSGYRSEAVQERLRRAPHRRGFVAMGTSHHTLGDAADIHGNLPWFHKHAAEYGLHFPMSWENWHIQDLHGVKGRATAGPGGGRRALNARATGAGLPSAAGAPPSVSLGGASPPALEAEKKP